MVVLLERRRRIGHLAEGIKTPVEARNTVPPARAADRRSLDRALSRIEIIRRMPRRAGS
jgi:hypothetical protein